MQAGQAPCHGKRGGITRLKGKGRACPRVLGLALGPGSLEDQTRSALQTPVTAAMTWTFPEPSCSLQRYGRFLQRPQSCSWPELRQKSVPA